MRYILILAIAINSYGGILDFNYLDKAKDAYTQGDYLNASQNYAKVSNDEARYNLANSLYKQKKYNDALGVYSSISNKNLEFKKLHNIGNTLAQLGKTDEAIQAYEDALKIKDDKDTKFNLELLKKQKKDKKKNKDTKQKQDKKNKKQDKKKKDSQKQNKNQKSQKDKKNENKKSDKKSQEKSNDNKKKRENTKQKEKKDTKAQKQKQQKVKKDEKQVSKKTQQAKNQPISNMEERKWQKMLNQKQINTLMLPIREGEKNNEKTPW